MWSKDNCGKWLHRESVLSMSEGASEIGESAGGATFQVGDSVTAFTNPLTEGLVIARNVTEDSKLELSIIVAPHKKRGQAWQRATVVTRDAARLSKKMAVSFTFPIKNVEFLRLEARNAKADPAWAFATCVSLDRQFCGTLSGSGASESEEQYEEIPPAREVSKEVSQPYNPEAIINDRRQELLEARVEEVVQLKGKSAKNGKVKGKYEGLLSDSDYENVVKARRRAKNKKKKKSHKKRGASSSSDHSDSSSSSSSDSSRASGEVGEKGRSGRFTCPFHREDNRGFKDIRLQIRGQAVIRKHIRVALHNLYGEYTTMKSLADAVISQANNSPYKPFSSDTAWLTAYARNIDAILLRSLGGPWSAWNEPVLDEMMIGFLDLLVRVSPNKEYPLCLDDSVRKWMKKKRVGANPKFGPVSHAVQHAKFTEFGPVVYQAGWPKQRDRSFGRPNTTTTISKGPGNTPGGGEKKPPPPAQG